MAKKAPELTKVQQSYITSNQEFTDEQLAEDLEVPVATVTKIRQKFRKAGVTHPLHHKGSTVMTRAASKAGEESVTYGPSLKETLMNDPDITIINPNEDVM